MEQDAFRKLMKPFAVVMKESEEHRSLKHLLDFRESDLLDLCMLDLAVLFTKCKDGYLPELALDDLLSSISNVDNLIVYEYIKVGLLLVRHSYSPDYIQLRLTTEFFISLNQKKISDDEVFVMTIFRQVLPSLQLRDVLEFQNYYSDICSEKMKQQISSLLANNFGLI